MLVRMQFLSRLAPLLKRRFWLISGALIAIMGIVQVTSVLQETETWDEGIHIAAGYSYLLTGDYRMNPEHPALGKILCALPLRLFLPRLNLDRQMWLKNTDEVDVGVKLVYLSRVSPDVILFLGRSVTILLTLLFAAWVAFWTRKHFGPVVALFALVLFTFDPNIIAHGRYVTTDLIASFFIFLAATLWIDFLLDRTWKNLTLAGLALGLALSSKYSALFLPPVLLIVYWIRYRFERPSPGQGHCLGWKHFAASAVISMTLATSVIALVYFPETIHPYRLGRLRPLLIRREPFYPLMDFAARKLSLHAFAYFIGVDQLLDHNYVGHESYLLGRVDHDGWHWYFPVAFLVKTPTGVLLGILIALAVLAAGGWRLARGRWFELIALALPAAIFFALCVASHIDIGHRHMLPVYAFLYVLLAYALVELSPPVLKRWRPWALACVLLLTAGESLAIYPNYLAFFNFVSGGPGYGPHYLLDSNIDWGQSVKQLGWYMKKHRIDHVCVSFFGHVDFARYGVPFDGIPPDPALQPKINCVAAISVTPLYGLYVPYNEYAYFRSLHPMAKIGYSIYLYDLRNKKP
jgi:Dolichyl-phosphate-mannose-protein mannosyltransferase